MSKKSDTEFAEMTVGIATHAHVLGDGDTEPERDEKGRVVPDCMTDREMLKEILTAMRTTQDALENFVGSAAKNPMFKMLGLGK